MPSTSIGATHHHRCHGAGALRSAWATSHIVTTETVGAIAAAGRCRWEIPDEINITLKTKGYHFEHNMAMASSICTHYWRP